jgi:3-phenylpropionate/cinnamic acid dioxygenase small subunit
VLATIRQEAAAKADQLAARIFQLEAERAEATSGHNQTQTLLGKLKLRLI